MANRIQPHPNPPYLKSDGSLNVSGKLELYEAGTTTAKVAYKDAAGTSYGSSINLNSSGLPTDGPIYWDTAALYKVEVYTRTDDTPTYALDYTVDNFGNNQFDGIGIIQTGTTWTVDGVGATSTTFASVGDAMAEARKNVITGDGGGLTINVNAGTYVDDIVDLSHPQGAYISIVGAGEATTILKNETIASPILSFQTGGTMFGTLSDITIKQNVVGQHAMYINNPSTIADLSDVTFDYDLASGGAVTCILMTSNATVKGTSITISNALQGIECYSGASLTINNIDIDSSSATGSIVFSVLIDGAGTSFSMASVCTYLGASGNLVADAIICQNHAFLACGSQTTVTDATDAFVALTGGKISIFDSVPTFAGTVTNQYNLAVNTLSTTGANAGSLITV